jgi:hypothetical protein
MNLIGTQVPVALGLLTILASSKGAKRYDPDYLQQCKQCSPDTEFTRNLLLKILVVQLHLPKPLSGNDGLREIIKHDVLFCSVFSNVPRERKRQGTTRRDGRANMETTCFCIVLGCCVMLHHS